jgi:hypothetical protein
MPHCCWVPMETSQYQGRCSRLLSSTLYPLPSTCCDAPARAFSRPRLGRVGGPLAPRNQEGASQPRKAQPRKEPSTESATHMHRHTTSHRASTRASSFPRPIFPPGRLSPPSTPLPRRSHAAPSRPLSRHPVDECPYSSPCQLQVATVASWLLRRDWLARLCPVDTTTHNVACALHPPILPFALPIAHSHPKMTTPSRPGSCKQPSCLIRHTWIC